MTTAPRYSLREAAETFFRGGRVTARTLARYVRQGRLAAESVGGQYFVTESAVASMLAASTVQPKRSAPEEPAAWPAPENRPGCGSA
ncbi:MAG: helix-turn-helix domain-containing protein, partial [Hyphomicrobiaceae bacterium]